MLVHKIVRLLSVILKKGQPEEVPDHWGKKPSITLIFKKVKKEDRGIYRMFSLTSIPEKIQSKSFQNSFPALLSAGKLKKKRR